MTAHSLEAAQVNPAVRYIDKQQKASLVSAVEELASLRFSIVLNAKWEADDATSSERRAELRTELSSLRASYLDKIDHIAMTFGVQKAMDAKHQVERATALPDDTSVSTMLSEAKELYF